MNLLVTARPDGAPTIPFPVRVVVQRQLEPLPPGHREHAQVQADAAQQALDRQMPDLGRRMEAIANSREPQRVQLRAFAAFTEEIASIIAPFSPCFANGWNACCDAFRVGAHIVPQDKQ